ncbi:LacI family transcriptional regulator [Arthrobacter echini]|uniref:LacI family transcriptional regulator n=1 Tax=Arthrobacter echini TaxID=1529066 RepID=A0A5D0XU86_9MICC|nr:LacI family DNA-binding transcriptional regulator [Arthrobacter echini]TYD00284.1 LacI family transcriptional regulator [Arthrobacter echini]
MVGIRDVAHRAGVSTATVSRALSGNGRVSVGTRTRVLEAASELGFVASSTASSLASGRHRNIGVVVPSVARWYYSQIVDSVAAALLQAGYDLTLYNLNDDAALRESVLSEFLLRQRCDGVIPVSLELGRDELDQLLSVGKPVVGIGGPLPGAETYSVDDHEIAALATEHLIRLGHRRIAHIGGFELAEKDFRIAGTRRHGYEAALAGAGLEARRSWQVAADFTIQSGMAEARQLLGHPHDRPTAVFCTSDEMAIGALLAARELGLRVPDDVSIIGIDGHELGEALGLTTVAQFPQEQGRRAVERLLQVLQDPSTLRSVNHPARTALVVRASTAAPTV